MLNCDTYEAMFRKYLFCIGITLLQYTSLLPCAFPQFSIAKYREQIKDKHILSIELEGLLIEKSTALQTNRLETPAGLSSGTFLVRKGTANQWYLFDESHKNHYALAAGETMTFVSNPNALMATINRAKEATWNQHILIEPVAIAFFIDDSTYCSNPLSSLDYSHTSNHRHILVGKDVEVTIDEKSLLLVSRLAKYINGNLSVEYELNYGGDTPESLVGWTARVFDPQRRETLKQEVTVTKLALNPALAPEKFKIDLPVGTQVHNLVTQEQYRLGAGGLREPIKPRHRKIDEPTQKGTLSDWVGPSLLTCIVILALFVFIKQRSMR